MKKFISTITAMAVMSTSTSLVTNAKSYTPQWGDCWSTVAEDHNLTLQELLDANNATVNTMMYCGVPITIPDKGSSNNAPSNTYVEKIYPQLGDGWYSISERTGYSVSSLRSANPNYEYPIYGEALNAPTSGSISAPTYTQRETFIGSRTLYNNPWGNSWYNIKKSASELNGMRVNAWNYFSFYEYFPHHCGYGGGYLWAGAYNNASGAYGGGICFTSTTLWQTAVEVCGMQSWVRYNHVYPVSYAVQGRDAAVNLAEDINYRQDMQFFNNLGYDVKFYTSTNDYTGALTISAYRVS